MKPSGTSSPAPWVQRFHWAGFLAIQALVCFLLFRPVIMGKSIFSPLDIAPNIFAKYRYLDPNASGVPANHYIVDMILGDLSRNFLVYEAWQRGEWPWWDPYTDGGKPLAAEANAVNVSDPFKVLFFHVLPFEAAYNWVRIVPFILSGLFAYLLLRHFKFSFAVSMWGGLLYSFAGCNFLMFSGPTVQAGFAYYPLLWLLWDKAVDRTRFMWFSISAFVSALIFLSGNLQSHSYPFLFACAFLVGYGWKHKERWGPLLGGITVSLAGGLCLAAPFVMSQIELFVRGSHLTHPFKPSSVFSGTLSLSSSFFPWVLGTFRTLDLSKFTGQGALGFWVYIGSIALVIAVLGAIGHRPVDTRERDRKRTSLALVLIYLIVCSTPLVVIFYTRTAWLAVLGFAVLFAFGWCRLASASAPFKRCAALVIGITLLVSVALNVAGLWIYPRFEKEIQARILATPTASFGKAEALRRFQVANLPDEITFKNRETLAAALGLIGLGVVLLRLPNRRAVILHGLLVVNMVPLLWFGQRYIPMQPLAVWRQLLEGGPEQRRAAELLRPEGLRLLELTPDPNDFLFPGALSQLFKVHVWHGHSSMVIKNAHVLGLTASTNLPGYSDYIYRSLSGQPAGELVRQNNDSRGTARFHWAEETPRTVSITNESLTRLELAVSSGPAADLIRTDSYYPGWRIESDGTGAQMSFEPPCFFRIHIPAETRRLTLVYEPRWLRPGLWIAGGAVVIFGVLTAVLAARGTKG
jgi:hypothetical protein